MPATPAVSVSPVSAIPEIVGTPLAATLKACCNETVCSEPSVQWSMEPLVNGTNRA